MNDMLKEREIWYQDPVDNDLWHHESGLIVNTAALEERQAYYTIIRHRAQHVPAASSSVSQHCLA
jgi:hypothetical protein